MSAHVDEHSPMTLEALRTVPLFASLSDESATELRDLLRVRALPAGTLLFRKGDRGDAMYLIEGGSVRIYIIDEDGDEVTLAELEQGDFFGEMALVDGQPRTAFAAVAADARLAELRREDFLAFVRRNPEVALAMVSAISERLRRTDELLHQRVTRNVNEEEEARMTRADRVADELANFFGGWRFVVVSLVLIVVWVSINAWVEALRGGGVAPDPFPYEILALLLGIVAGVQAPIILMSQNRQAEKERLRAENDYRVNLKNELAIEEILRRLDVLESERLPVLFAEQNELLIGRTGKDANGNEQKP
jgi:CRP/FNR family transcriptional regulator, cyclic AMP receptor protein